MIKLEKECECINSQFQMLEECVFCDTPSPYWHVQTNNCVCKSCSQLHDESELVAPEGYVYDPADSIHTEDCPHRQKDSDNPDVIV